jgi:hypothetical protein
MRVLAHRALEQHGRLQHEGGAPAQLAGVDLDDRPTVEAHDAGRRLLQAVETAEQRRLARARGADEGEGAAALDVDRDVIQDRRRGPGAAGRIRQGEVPNLKDRVVHRDVRRARRRP